MSLKLIATTTVGSGGAANIEFTSIPGTYTDLLLVYNLRDTGTNSTFRVHQTAISFNSSTSNFSSRVLAGSGDTAFTFSDAPRFSGWHPDAGSTANTFGNSSLYILNYSGSTNKPYSIDNFAGNFATITYMGIVAGLWSNSDAITGITLTTLGTNYAIGSTASLYGITKGSDGIVTTS
jgi:hypothetical protein